jgi:hypothetical protein
MMTPALRRTLVNLIERHSQTVIADGDITILGDNLDPGAETLVATVRESVAAAQALVAARPPALETPPVRPVPPVTSSPSSVEPASVAGPGRAAKQESSEPEGKATSAASPPPKAEPPAPPAPPTPPPAATPATGLPAEFFEDVFGANRLSFEEDEVFEKEIRGRTVTLSGTIKRASTYTGDDELSPTEGSKAIVTVAQIETDLYGKSDIDAVVYLDHLPADDLERGGTIEFSGTIEQVDPFMRNLFIVNATRIA